MQTGTFTEIAAEWAQQGEEVSEVVGEVALHSERQALSSDGKSDHVDPDKTRVSGNHAEEPREALRLI